MQEDSTVSRKCRKTLQWVGNAGKLHVTNSRTLLISLVKIPSLIRNLTHSSLELFPNLFSTWSHSHVNSYAKWKTSEYQILAKWIKDWIMRKVNDMHLLSLSWKIAVLWNFDLGLNMPMKRWVDELFVWHIFQAYPYRNSQLCFSFTKAGIGNILIVGSVCIPTLLLYPKKKKNEKKKSGQVWVWQRIFWGNKTKRMRDLMQPSQLNNLNCSTHGSLVKDKCIWGLMTLNFVV